MSDEATKKPEKRWNETLTTVSTGIVAVIVKNAHDIEISENVLMVCFN